MVPCVVVHSYFKTPLYLVEVSSLCISDRFVFGYSGFVFGYSETVTLCVLSVEYIHWQLLSWSK